MKQDEFYLIIDDKKKGKYYCPQKTRDWRTSCFIIVRSRNQVSRKNHISTAYNADRHKAPNTDEIIECDETLRRIWVKLWEDLGPKKKDKPLNKTNVLLKKNTNPLNAQKWKWLNRDCMLQNTVVRFQETFFALYFKLSFKKSFNNTILKTYSRFLHIDRWQFYVSLEAQ